MNCVKTRNTVYKFSPVLRTEDQAWAFRVVLQALVYPCDFGINYFDLENAGHVKTATEIPADSSALTRNI